LAYRGQLAGTSGGLRSVASGVTALTTALYKGLTFSLSLYNGTIMDKSIRSQRVVTTDLAVRIT